MKKILIVLACAGIAAGVKAEIRNGSYDGTMKCGAMLANVAQGPWTQPIQIQVAGTSISWSRSDGRYTESGSGTLQAGRLSLSLDGGWNPGVNKTGNWRTVAMLNLEGSQLTGPATIFSADGQQRVRDCTVTVPVKMSQSVQIKPDAIPAKPAFNSQSVPQTIAQIGMATKQKIPAMLGAVVGQVPSTGAATGPMFNTKMQFLEKTRDGHFLDLDKFSGDKSSAFSASVQVVLRNDYGVAALPNDVGCKGEFEGNVNSLLGQTVRAYVSTLDDRPPQFTNPNRNIQTERKSIEEAVARLPSQRDGWCSAKGIAHAYLTALPKLLLEFDAATAQAVNERRSQWQVQYQRKEADEAARKRADDEAQWTQKANTENARREKEQAAKNQREAQERGAVARNQSQIRALGLSSDFVASTLYTNFMGQWSPLMPSNQWLGLLLENKKIASVQATSVRGYPGVSIKRTGQPAVGIVFRMEGKEAYVFGMVVNGRLEQIQSPADHSQVALMLKALTIEEATN